MGDDLITLVVKYLQRRDAFENEGVGVIINTTKPFEKKHRWPYKLNKGSLEKIRYKRVVEIRKKSNDELLAIAKNRKEAITLSKELIPSIQEDIYGRIIYQPNRYEFELNYIPNDVYKYGQYIVFGVEDADVRASKRKRRNYI